MSEEDSANINGNNGNNQQQHAAQWERQSEWLERLRSHKKQLEAKGVQGWDLLEAMTTLSLEHKILTSRHRCSRCWHDPSNCICSELVPLDLLEQQGQQQGRNTISIQTNVKILILMHHKEYLCAGNSAKLLLQLLPAHTELYIFGKTGDFDRLSREMAVDRQRTMILWPGQTSLSVSEFLARAETTSNNNNKTSLDRDAAADETTTATDSAPRPQQQTQPPLLIRAIVLDGTYTQARNMHNSLRKRLGVNQLLPVAVALHPPTASVFHRAQKNYGKAHQHHQQGAEVARRISTAEACGLLLTELGTNKSVQESIVKAVVANNDALAYARGKQTSTNKPPTFNAIPSSRCLWKTPSDGGDDDDHDHATEDNDNNKTAETYDSVLKSFSAQPPPPKSLSTLCCNSLVVGQEFALTCLFWARHRVTIWEEELRQPQQQQQHETMALQEKMVQSQCMALVALVVIAVYANSNASPPQPQPRKAKVQQRTFDAILLAILLRLCASVLRTLTASFSTDTVESLTVAGMAIHWLTCDYSYANATNSRTITNNRASSEPDKTTAAETKTSLDVTTSSKRPTFQGGTVSLNAAFFSTTLLASRLSSNATVYIFVSSAIILFAFFPAARHAISHHPHRAMIHAFVTLMISWSTYYLLQDMNECLYYASVLVTICGVAPLWKFWLQRYKRKISGPWDVVSASEMMLDY